MVSFSYAFLSYNLDLESSIETHMLRVCSPVQECSKVGSLDHEDSIYPYLWVHLLDRLVAEWALTG